jgi:hypothetical protein
VNLHGSQEKPYAPKFDDKSDLNSTKYYSRNKEKIALATIVMGIPYYHDAKYKVIIFIDCKINI